MKTPRSVRHRFLSVGLFLLVTISVLVFQLGSSDPPEPVFLSPERPGVANPAAAEPLQAKPAAPVEPTVTKLASAKPVAARPETSKLSALNPVPGEPSPRPGVAGMVIGLDPETGAWGPPTPEQLRELSEKRRLSGGDEHRVAKPGGPLPEIHHPDGHVSVDLNGQFQEFTVVRIGPDGKPVFTCVHGSHDAEPAIEQPAAPALEER